jgi:hypothetical protein
VAGQQADAASEGERLDMLCGHFVIAPPHDRLLRRYLPPRLVVHAGNDNFNMVRSGTATQLAGHPERAGFVVLKRPPAPAHAVLGRTADDSSQEA